MPYGQIGNFAMDPDKDIDYDNLSPSDIIAVIIPSPNVEQESTRRFKGIHSRGGSVVVDDEDRPIQSKTITLRFSIIEQSMLEAASAALGVKRFHFIRQSALSMAEAVLNGTRSDDHPNTRNSLEGYRRRKAGDFSQR